MRYEGGGWTVSLIDVTLPALGEHEGEQWRVTYLGTYMGSPRTQAALELLLGADLPLLELVAA